MASFMNAAGAQAALLRLMEQLRARGHETETWYFYQEQSTFAGRAGVYTFFAKPRLSVWEYAQLPLRVIAKLRAARPDAVVTFLPLACIVGQSAAALVGVPRRIASQRTPSWAHSFLMRVADRLCGEWLYTANVCVSRSVEESFAAYPSGYRRRLAVVENGIDWRASSLTREEARRKFGLSEKDVAFVAVGRLKAQKNYGLMLDAFAGVIGGILLIAGDGPQMESLVARVKALGVESQVRFLGALSPGEVADLLGAADVFVQTSAFEGMSNATLEAMSEGLAIVTSDIRMQREVLETREGELCGWLLPLSRPEEWTQAFARLISSADLRATLGSAAKSHVGRRFGLDRMIDGFERILLTPTAGKGSQRLDTQLPST